MGINSKYFEIHKKTITCENEYNYRHKEYYSPQACYEFIELKLEDKTAI